MTTTKKTTTAKETTRKKPATRVSKAAPKVNEESIPEEVNSEVEAQYAAEEAKEAAKAAADASAKELAAKEDVNIDDGDPKDAEEPDAPSEEPTNPQLNTIEDVASYLQDPNIDIEDKLNVMASNAPIAVRSILGTLLGYLKEGDITTPDRGEEYTLGMLYNVYTVIKSIVETADDTEFRVKMDILNLIVLNNKDAGRAFNELRLLRYDYLWHWGVTSLHTYQVLVSVICGLADLSTREEMLKRIDLSSELMTSGTELSSEHVERFVRYYMQ